MPYSSQIPWYVRQEAKGMVPHGGGMLGGSGMGRTDSLPIAVPSGSYVLSSDIVSGIGQGNSAAGAKLLDSYFNRGPLGMATMHVHSSFGGPKNLAMGRMKMPLGSRIGSILSPTKYQTGGAASSLDPTSGPYLDNPTDREMQRRYRYPYPSAGQLGVIEENMEERSRRRPDLPVQPRPKNIARGGSHPAPPGHTPIVAASGEYVIPSSWILQRFGDLKKGHDVLDKLVLQLREKHRKTLARLPGPVKR
jgi:hypothetical protein